MCTLGGETDPDGQVAFLDKLLCSPKGTGWFPRSCKRVRRWSWVCSDRFRWRFSGSHALGQPAFQMLWTACAKQNAESAGPVCESDAGAWT